MSGPVLRIQCFALPCGDDNEYSTFEDSYVSLRSTRYCLVPHHFPWTNTTGHSILFTGWISLQTIVSLTLHYLTTQMVLTSSSLALVSSKLYFARRRAEPCNMKNEKHKIVS